MENINLFDFILDNYKITKPIRLIEFFAGIGSQLKSLKLLGANVESYKICERAYNSYIGYNAIHIKDFTDYAKDLTKEQIIEKVKGTSINYNEPLTTEQLNKKPIECMRLMAFEDSDTLALYDAGLSNNAIYHVAGDSICVNVLMAIFGKFLLNDNEIENKIIDYVEELKENDNNV